jgi:hypothetical protein
VPHERLATLLGGRDDHPVNEYFVLRAASAAARHSELSR